MDTRNKIVEAPAAAAAAREWRARGGTPALVRGYFELLDAAAAAELARAGNAAPRVLLVAAVVEHTGAVLAARARAGMVAAVGMVDYVVTVENEAAADALEAALSPGIAVRCEASHRERMRRLIEHVHQRYSGVP